MLKNFAAADGSQAAACTQARWDRRQLLKCLGFLTSSLLLTAAWPLGGRVFGSSPALASVGTVPRRPLGKTGVEVSALALGGAHLGRTSGEREAIRLVHEAIEAGITFMDNAWEYHNGYSEEIMGKALQGRRHQAFLMTKVCTHGRDKNVAMSQLDESLRRLRTDYLDLWQIHEVIYDNDPELIFRPGGAADALMDAKRQGKVRFVGFTGHKDPSIHLEVLKYQFPFDTCQLATNVFDGTFRSFERDVIPELHRQGIAPLGMKALSGNGDPIKQGVLSAEEALRYALSLPVASIVTGIDSREILQQNFRIAREFVPLTEEQMAALRQKMASYAADGRFELFKSSGRYDGPIGRKQHGVS